jgi:hypothetical protein
MKVSEIRLMWYRMGTFGDISTHRLIKTYLPNNKDQAHSDMAQVVATNPEHLTSDRYYVSSVVLS